MLKRLVSIATVLVMMCTMILIPVTAVAETTSVIANNAVYACRRTFGGGYYDSVSNKTFVCWNGPQMDVYVKEYDHATNTWGSDIKVVDVDMSDTNAYHDYAVMQQMPDGKPAIFYNSHTNNAYMLKAPNANSIAGTWTKTTISSDKNCYAMPITFGSNVYFFYNRDDDQSWPYRTYKYIMSTDSGASWTTPVSVIDSGKTADKFNEVYAYGVSNTGGRISITWSMSGGPDGHNGASKDLYYAYLNPADNNIYNVAGTSMGTGINGLTELAGCKVVDAPALVKQHQIENSIPAVMDDGTVVVTYGHDTGGGNLNIKCARYLSGSWVISTIVSGTKGIKDMAKVGSTNLEVLYVTADGLSTGDIKTLDKGATWNNIYSVGIPFNNGADGVSSLNFIESRSTIRAVGTTRDGDTKKTDFTGKWPVFVVNSDSVPTPTPTPTPRTVEPVADAYVRGGDYASTNFGTETSMMVKKIDVTESKYNRKTFLKFDLTEAGLTSVTNAKVRLYCASSDGAFSVEAYRTTDSWTETGINWNNAPALGTLIENENISTTGQYYEFDVTSYVNDQLSGDKIVSLGFYDADSSEFFATFNSKENSTAKPQLVIQE